MSFSFENSRVGQEPSLRQTLDRTQEKQKTGKLSLSNGDVSVKLLPGDSDVVSPLRLKNRSESEPKTEVSPSSRQQSAPRRINWQIKSNSHWSQKLGMVIALPLAWVRGAIKGFAAGAASGAAVGAVGGAIAGGVGGSVVLPGLGTVAGAGAGAGAGALVGGSLGGVLGIGAGLGAGTVSSWDLSNTLFSGQGRRPQYQHAAKAMDSLRKSGWQLTETKIKNLEQVNDKEWRQLLHVPKEYKYSIHRLSGGVKGQQNRQKIREAVMLYTAEHGKAGAAAFRDRLIRLARSSPKELQSEINKLKAGFIGDRMEQIGRMENRKAQSEAFAQLIRANPDFFSHPSDLYTKTQNNTDFNHFTAYTEHFGLQSALAVVDRLERQQVVTKQDHEDLNRALNILGKSDSEAFRGLSDIKDVLKGNIGKQFTPELKHKVAQAIFKQFGDREASYGLNLYEQPRKNLENVLDATVFERADKTERARIATQEIEALRRAGLNTLVKDGMGGEIANQLIEPLRNIATEFDPLMQRPQNREPSDVQIDRPPIDKSNLERLKSLRDEYAPDPGGIGKGGGQFERIRIALGLEDKEFDPKALHTAISKQLMQTFGSFGENLPSRIHSNQKEIRSESEKALLRAIAGQMAIENMTGNQRVDKERATELQDRANLWLKQGMPESEALQSAKKNYSIEGSGKPVNQLISDLRLQQGDLPKDIQSRIDKALSQLFETSLLEPTKEKIDKAIGEVLVGAAVELADTDNASFAQQQRAVYAAARHEALYQTDPGSYLRSDSSKIAHLRGIISRHDQVYTAKVVDKPKKSAFNGPPSSILRPDLSRPKNEEDYKQNRMVGLRDTHELNSAKNQAIDNIRLAMSSILGGKEKDSNQRQQAVKAVPERLRQLLATVDQGARDGNIQANRDTELSDKYSKAGILNTFVLRSLVPSYASPVRAKAIGVWDPPPETMENQDQHKSVRYLGNVITTIFNAPSYDKNFVPLDTDSPNEEANKQARILNPLFQEVKQERDSWQEPAGTFLMQLVESGRALNKNENQSIE